MKHHDRPPPNLASLRARLRNVCEEQSLVFGRAQRQLAVIVVGQLLRRLDGLVAIKGATNLEARLGTERTRVSSDLDATVRTDLDELAESLREHLRVGWAGFTGTLSGPEQIATPTPDAYRPYRFRLSLQFQTKPLTTLVLEVAPDEIDGLGEVDYVDPAQSAEWIYSLGLPSPDAIPMLRIDHQIAQKLHACTAPDTGGWENDRVHDLVDLQLARGLYTGSLEQLRATAARLFAARKAHAWPPVVTARAGWGER